MSINKLPTIAGDDLTPRICAALERELRQGRARSEAAQVVASQLADDGYAEELIRQLGHLLILSVYERDVHRFRDAQWRPWAVIALGVSHTPAEATRANSLGRHAPERRSFRERTEAVLDRLFPLHDGSGQHKPLREFTRADCQRSLDYWVQQRRAAGREAERFRRLLASLEGDQTVGDRWNESEIARLEQDVAAHANLAAG